LSRQLDLWEPSATANTGTSVLTIPVVYDGPDLAVVATHLGVTAADVVTRHTSIEFVAAFWGFSPRLLQPASRPHGSAFQGGDILIEITDQGLLSTIQDQGRIGYAHLGVPRAGTGISFTVADAVTIAVTGAQAFLKVNGHERAFAEPVGVPAGARVTVGPARVGVRSYVAFGGGVDVTPVLGSRSTDTLAFVGPKILARALRCLSVNLSETL
jgi:hypothetical protein